MQNNNVSIVDGTTYVQVGAEFFPKNALSIDTQADRLISVRTLNGRQVTNWIQYDQYKDVTNAPYTSFANALAAMNTIFFK